MDTPCSEHDRDIASLKTMVGEHGKEIDLLRDKTYSVSNAVTTLSATLVRMEKNHEVMVERLQHHMDHEEAAFGKLYERLKIMDNELKGSFKERDDKIHELDKTQVRLLAFATIVFGAVTIGGQYALRLLFGT